MTKPATRSHRLARPLLLGLLAMAGFLPGCLSGPPPLAAGGEIRNLLPGAALDVRAVHEPTGTTAAVNDIPPGRRFLLSFPTREIRAESVTLTWRTANGEAYERTLDIPTPPAEMRDDVLWVVYSIRPGGDARIEFERASRSAMGY